MGQGTSKPSIIDLEFSGKKNQSTLSDKEARYKFLGIKTKKK